MEHCKFHSGIEARTDKNEKDIVNIYELIEKIRQRPPVWATFTFSIMTFVIGWLISRITKGG